MAIPYSYSLRNLWTRRLTTVLTVGGMALVVFVFAAMQMLAEGLRATLVETGSPENVVVLRKAAGTEVQSAIERPQAAIIESLPAIATGPDGSALAAKEVVVLITLARRGSDKPANVVLRGIDDNSLALRPQVKLVHGRMPRPGSFEIATGKGIAKRFQSAGIGETLRFALRDWTVVGVFEAGATGFDSEIWGDADQLMQAFRRTVYSVVVFRLRDSAEFPNVKREIEGDPRTALEAKRESQYYADQSEIMATFLRVFGAVLSVIFSVGAVIGAMITMYAAVANRTSEIGTLRALGFHRRSVLAAFLLEALLLGFLGGIAGLVFASLLQFFTVSTMNWQTFSELSFRFDLSTSIAAKSLLFSIAMGLVGGLLPSLRAARLEIVEALRTT